MDMDPNAGNDSLDPFSTAGLLQELGPHLRDGEPIPFPHCYTVVKVNPRKALDHAGLSHVELPGNLANAVGRRYYVAWVHDVRSAPTGQITQVRAFDN
jgi:hypothetical protein